MNQLKIKYDTSALVLPGRVTEVMDRASLTDMKVLIALCAFPELCRDVGEESWLLRVAEASGCDTEGVTSALAFWRGAGMISMSQQTKEREKKRKSETPVSEISEEKKVATPTDAAEDAPLSKPVKLRPKAELPHYTTEQLTTLLEAHTETAGWLNECQRIFGKVFNTHEVNTMLGFVDYLGLDWEYVLGLLAYYVETQERRGLPRSIRGAEKMAFDFYDKGILTVSALQEEIRRLTLFAETEGKLRALFGMGERSLTPKEKKCFSTWLYEFSYGMDIIRLAYDVTVDAKGSPNISYMNSVLANWHKDDLRTPEAVKAADEAHRAASADRQSGKKKKEDAGQSSFVVDDFFAAAVRRSMGEDAPPEYRNKE